MTEDNPETALSGADFARRRPATAPERVPAQPAPPVEQKPAGQVSPVSSVEQDQPPATGPLSPNEFLRARHRQARNGEAEWGWRATARKFTGGLVKPKMGPSEQTHHDNLDDIQRTFSGPRTIVVANPKGGAAKTPAVVLSAATFGTARGGGVLAWDNNELEGSLAERTFPAHHEHTVLDLLARIDEMRSSPSTRVGDLAAFVRGQGRFHFDVLASSRSGSGKDQVNADDFNAVHDLMTRFYRLVIVDTGNNQGAPNWNAAIATADLLVIPLTVQVDRGDKALNMLANLEDAGYGQLVKNAVTVISHHAPTTDPQIGSWLDETFSARTRTVVHVPYEPALTPGDHIQYDRLSVASREAWLTVCAAMARGL